MNRQIFRATGLIAILAAFLLIAGCAGVQAAGDGDTVKVHYTGTLSDGSIFDSSLERDPLEFTIGSQQVISGFEDAVRGMSVGEKQTVTIPYTNAYGPYYEDMVIPINRDLFAEDDVPEVGYTISFSTEDGRMAQGHITSVNETIVIIDMNHPLAGEDLTFEITLVEIV